MLFTISCQDFLKLLSVFLFFFYASDDFFNNDSLSYIALLDNDVVQADQELWPYRYLKNLILVSLLLLLLLRKKDIYHSLPIDLANYEKNLFCLQV